MSSASYLNTLDTRRPRVLRGDPGRIRYRRARGVGRSKSFPARWKACACRTCCGQRSAGWRRWNVTLPIAAARAGSGRRRRAGLAASGRHLGGFAARPSRLAAAARHRDSQAAHRPPGPMCAAGAGDSPSLRGTLARCHHRPALGDARRSAGRIDRAGKRAERVRRAAAGRNHQRGARSSSMPRWPSPGTSPTSRAPVWWASRTRSLREGAASAMANVWSCSASWAAAGRCSALRPAPARWPFSRHRSASSWASASEGFSRSRHGARIRGRGRRPTSASGCRSRSPTRSCRSVTASSCRWSICRTRSSAPSGARSPSASRRSWPRSKRRKRLQRSETQARNAQLRRLEQSGREGQDTAPGGGWRCCARSRWSRR